MASSDEEDLEALRNAALASLWKKREEQTPQGIQVVSTITQQFQGQVQPHPEAQQFTSEYDDIPAEVERLFLRQRGRGRGRFQRGRGGRGRGGSSPSFNPNPNVIVIPTLPMEGEEGEKTEKKSFFLRPQDKWGLMETGSGSSSPKLRDTSKFRRYDDDSESEEEEDEMNRTFQEADNDQNADSADTRNVVFSQTSIDAENAEQAYYENVSEVEFRSSELSQTKSDIEAAMEQSLYETVSEVESDVYYDTGVQSGQTDKVDNQMEISKTEEQVKKHSTSEYQNAVSKTEIPDKENLVHNKISNNTISQTGIETKVENEAVQVTSQKATETVKSEESLVTEQERVNINTDDINDKPKESNFALPNLSPDMTESDSKLSSSKFSRFNRKRRNSSGSESDASDISDVSSWSPSRRSPTEFENKSHDNSKSDVSSAPLPEGSSFEKDLSDSLLDSSSSSSPSDDESLVSSDSSLDLPMKPVPVKQKETTMSKTMSTSMSKEKAEPYRPKVSPQREMSHSQSRKEEKDKTDYKPRYDTDKKQLGSSKRDEALAYWPEKAEKKLESTSLKSEKVQKHEKDYKKANNDSYLIDSTHDKPKKQSKKETDKFKDKSEKFQDNRKTESNKDNKNRHREVADDRHFESVSFVSRKDTDKFEKKEKVKQLFPIKLEDDNNKSGVEQLVLDARKQELEKFGKEIKTVSLAGKVSKDKSKSDKKSKSSTESLRSKSHDSSESHSKSNSLKDKIAASVRHEESLRHDKNRHRKSRSPTPPKAYLKAINKKIEQKVIKRLGSISPPKAYSKDLKKVVKEKKRKSSHSAERKRRPSGSAKKNRKSDSKRNDSDSESAKSISSLSDTDSDSETENWRDKKSGVSRKRDDIERERRIRQAAERENRRKERKDIDFSKDSNDRDYNDKRGGKYSGRSNNREGRTKTEIDSFDARDYRQHDNRDDRNRFHRDFHDSRKSEKVFFRKNKTFVEEEPLISKTTFFEEEVSDDSLGKDRKGVVSVIKPNRKRLSHEADLEDIKISTKHAKHKHEDLNTKVKKERLIISVQESSGDEKDKKSLKTQKTETKKKKSKHKSHDKKVLEEKGVKEQTVKLVFDKGEVDKPRKSVYDRLGALVTKHKESSSKQGTSSKSGKDRDKSSKSKGKDHSKSRDKDHRSDGARDHKDSSDSAAIRKVYREEETGKRKDSLNAKIQKIHEKNAEILRRQQEIEQDRQKYG